MSENPSPNPLLRKHAMYVLVNQQIDHVNLMPIHTAMFPIDGTRTPPPLHSLVSTSSLCLPNANTFESSDGVCGGRLWDVLECVEGTVKERDLKWGAGQCVSAIGWCHNQGFAHRCAHLLSPFIALPATCEVRVST